MDQPRIKEEEDEEDSLFVSGNDDTIIISGKGDTIIISDDSSDTEIKSASSEESVKDDPVETGTLNTRKRKYTRRPAIAKPRKRDTTFVKKLNGARSGKDIVATIAKRSRREASPASDEPPPEYTADQLEKDERAMKAALEILGKKIEEKSREQNGKNVLYLLKGMKTPIHDYQLVGAAFMVRHERYQQGPRGGIIADDMGIGKTIQAIACMEAHKPTKAEHKPTLVVVPSEALVHQWENMMTNDISGKPAIQAYTAGCKIPSNFLQRADYLIATYHRVLHESKRKGPLFDIDFHRIVLDEGDSIKNIKGSISQACADLTGTYKWVLSGTPLKNNLKEALSYLRFIGIEITGSRAQFEGQFGCLKQDTKQDRILKVLGDRMNRRERIDYFMGRKICDIPQNRKNDAWVDMATEERVVYSFIEYIIQMRVIEAYQNFHDTQKASVLTLSLLLRLRQASSHPFLLEAFIRATLKPEETHLLRKKLSSAKHQTHIDQKIRSRCSSVLAESLEAQLKRTQAMKEAEGCMLCDKDSNLVILECNHVICLDDLNTLHSEHIEYDEDEARCPGCAHPITPQEDASRTVASEWGQRFTAVPMRSRKKKESRFHDHNGVKPRLTSFESAWLDHYDRDPQSSIPPSAKTSEAVRYIKGSLEHYPNDKIIIYDEWVGTALVLGGILSSKGIRFVYYYGSLSGSARERSLDAFKSNPDIKVMLIGLKCGGAGLNIQSANRVLSMTLWWNTAVEEQAFARVVRHGQEKETHCVRVIARDTIDQRILKIQAKKQAEIERALLEGKKMKWTMEDAFELFGIDLAEYEDMKAARA